MSYGFYNAGWFYHAIAQNLKLMSTNRYLYRNKTHWFIIQKIVKVAWSGQKGLSQKKSWV